MSEPDAQAVQGRVDVISYSVQAEISHFNQHRVNDFKVMMQNYLQGQISFYQNVSLFAFSFALLAVFQDCVPSHPIDAISWLLGRIDETFGVF